MDNIQNLLEKESVPNFIKYIIVNRLKSKKLI